MERSTVAGRPALTVRGELDIATAPQLADAAQALLSSSPEAIVVDLTPTVFLDSSGAHTLVTIARRAAAAGALLHVVAPRNNCPVRLPIDLLQLDSVVPIVDSAGEIPSIAADHDAT
ncbi:STAS domain-containing protein [Blastococcus sp. SYSU DS0619]